MLSNCQIKSYLENREKVLINRRNRKKIKLSRDWVNKLPAEPGIYVVFENNKVVYVGETGNIRGRMKDLLDSRHHILRRNIGRYNFSNEPNYENATTKKRFPEHIEKKVNQWLEKKTKVSILPLKIGRKELEETLVRKYNPKYNKRGQRNST